MGRLSINAMEIHKELELAYVVRPLPIVRENLNIGVPGLELILEPCECNITMSKSNVEN